MARRRWVRDGLAVAAVLAAALLGFTACADDPSLEDRWDRLDLSEPAITFLGDFSDREQAAITREVKGAQVAGDDLFGVATSDFTLYISTERAALEDPWLERIPSEISEEGLPDWFTCSGFTYEDVIFIVLETCDDDARARGGPIAYNYARVLQNELGYIAASDQIWPSWLLEGSAEYVRARQSELRGRAALDDSLAGARETWSAMRGAGVRFPAPASVFPADELEEFFQYVSLLAVDWLRGQRGPGAFAEFFRRGGGPEAFEPAFGMTPEEFAAAFQEHSQQAAPAYRWLHAGAVLDADGEPVANAWVGPVVEVDGERWGPRTDAAGADGAFAFNSPGAGHTLGVFLLLECPADAESNVWFFAGEAGRDGFVADDDGWWPLDADGPVPFGVSARTRHTTIRLPDTPAALTETYC